MRLPSLSGGMECGDCGITFDIFTHVLARVCFFVVYFIYTLRTSSEVHNDDLEDGYKVAPKNKYNEQCFN